MTNWLRRTFSFKEIGWKDIGEEFTRYALWRTRWFNVYLHELTAPNWHPECHNHPWGFITIFCGADISNKSVARSTDAGRE